MNDDGFYKAPPSKPFMYDDFIRQWSASFPVKASDAIIEFINHYDHKFCIDLDDFFIALKDNGYTWNKETNIIIKN